MMSRHAGILVFVWSILISAVWADLLQQVPFPNVWESKTVPTKNAYDQVIEQFSAEAVENHALLHNRFLGLYPNSSVTVTSERGFQLLSYAASSIDQILIKEKEDVQSLKQIIFKPAHRRRDGGSNVNELVKIAGYEVAWREETLQAFIVTWNEGPYFFLQWHIVGDSQTARDLIRVCCAWSAQPREVVWVYSQGFWRADHELWSAVQKASWSDIILDEEFKANLVNDYRSFFKSEETYKSFEVPWKRGLILLGPPGNGKTISVKAIMKEVNVPILYVKSFKTFFGDEFGIRDIFERARAEAPCVLVLEDLDSLITDLNRSFFLNEVDGLEDNDGLLLIGTTNHFDRLDPALSSRPSRFDRKYDFPNPTWSERRQFALYWQRKLARNKEIVFPYDLLDKVANKSEDFSFAYLQEAFVSSLLTLAGIDSPRDRPQFASVLMGQIRKLKQQLEAGKDKLFDNSTVHSTSSDGAHGGFEPPWMHEEEMKKGLQFPAGQMLFGEVF